MLKVLDDICKPTKGSKHSAAIDLYASQDAVIGAGETVKVPLGVCIDFDRFWKDYSDNNLFDKDEYRKEKFKESFFKRHYLQLEPRSSLRAKGLIAGTGIIDLDYRDEIMIILHNPVTEHTITWWIDRLASLVGFKTNFNKDDIANYQIKKGDKIAQILLKEHKTYLMGVDTQEERIGGFGSTDKKIDKTF